MDRGANWALLVLTLILQLEPWPVLGVVAVEIHGGLVGRGEQGAWKLASTESAHHAAGLMRAVPDFDEVMIGLGGEVQELDVSSWEQDRGRQCPKQYIVLFQMCRLGKLLPARAHVSLPLTSYPIRIPRTDCRRCRASPASCLQAGLNLKSMLFTQKEERLSFLSSILSPFYFIENKVQD